MHVHASHICTPQSSVSHRTGLTINASADVVKNGFTTAPKVTVEAIDPPSRIIINHTVQINLLVKNHSSVDVNAIVELRRRGMQGVVVSGQSVQPTQVLKPGGVVIVTFNVLGLVAGLCVVGGCVVVDTVTGGELVQPPLFSMFVERKDEEGGDEVLVTERLETANINE